MYNVEIREQPERHLVGFNHKGPFMGLGDKFLLLGHTLFNVGLLPDVIAMAGVFFDDPGQIEEKKLRSFAGAIMTTDATPPEPLETLTLPAGRAAVLRLKGPYEGLPAAYDYFYNTWMAEAGESPAEHPPFEIYLNDPKDTAPEDLLTDIHVMLA